jgi:RNA polymerase sigma-70 factor (ECF subfamily)
VSINTESIILSAETSFNEKQLFQLVAGSDQGAFRRLFDHYNKTLFTFAIEMTKSAADAEEIIQDCFTKLWVNRAELERIEQPGQYLYKMVRNRSLDYIRKVSRQQRLIDQVWNNLSQQDAGPEDLLRSKEYQVLIDRAIAQLPGQKQLIYRLSREKECSHEQIAAQTGLSKSRVNNILVEALKQVKAYLAAHSDELALVFWLSVLDVFL